MSESVPPGPDQYNQDRLITIRNHDFMESPPSRRLSARTAGGGHRLQLAPAGAHCSWAAAVTSKLPGDFVECGVNRGFLRSAIMQSLDWDRLRKQFYLLDTFRGVDERYVSGEDLTSGVIEKSNAAIDSGFYVVGFQSVRANVSE